MAIEPYDREQLGELRGFLKGYAKLQQALTISRYDYDATVLTTRDDVEATLQAHFDALGQKLKPPVKHWDLILTKLTSWHDPAEEIFARWLLADDELRQFYKTRRERDPRPGEVHVGTNDVARAFRRELESFLGPGRRNVWQASVHALVGASDRYLGTLDDHLAFELAGAILLVSFVMNR
jgi:hypothetical protein